MKKDNNRTIVKQVSASTSQAILNRDTKQFLHFAQELKILTEEGNKLIQSEQNQQLSEDRVSKLTNLMENSNSESVSTTLTRAYQDQKRNENQQLLVNWLNQVYIWATKAYRTTLAIREFFTDQEYVYDVQDKNTIFRLNKTQFMQLFSNQLTTRTNSDKIKTDLDLLKSLQIKLTSYNQVLNKNTAIRHIRPSYNKTRDGEDALYGFLAQNFSTDLKKINADNIQVTSKARTTTKKEKKTTIQNYRIYNDARLLELYDMLHQRLFLVINKNFNEYKSTYAFTKEEIQDHAQFIRNFGELYTAGKLHEDTDPYYNRGDAVFKTKQQNNAGYTYTQVENKNVTTQAAIRIGTIYNGIQELYDIFKNFIGDKSYKTMSKKLEELFIISKTNTTMANILYNGSEAEGLAVIKKHVGNIQINNITIKI